jgi:hypothetical protein
MLPLILHLARASLRSRESLILENIALRHQVQVLKRQQKRPQLRDRDRLLWILLRRIWPDWRRPLTIVQPKTVIRWHRKGFRGFWRWRSRTKRRGRPRLTLDEREFIRQMA